MPGRLEGKVAIVTGGASGFGKGIAAAFIREQCKVLVADFSQVAGEAVSKEIGAAFVLADVTKKTDWEKVLKWALETYGRLDIVVNNAGTTYNIKPTEEVTEEEFDLVFAVNVKSIYLATSVIVPYFLQQNQAGNFINIASTAAIRPRPNSAWYAGSKGAVSIASKAMAIEYASKRLRFNTVSPVLARTGLTTKFMGKADTDENRQIFERGIPLGRLCTPQDVANACIYLGSDEAQFITGIDLSVDGGRCI